MASLYSFASSVVAKMWRKEVPERERGQLSPRPKKRMRLWTDHLWGGAGEGGQGREKRARVEEQVVEEEVEEEEYDEDEDEEDYGSSDDEDSQCSHRPYWYDDPGDEMNQVTSSEEEYESEDDADSTVSDPKHAAELDSEERTYDDLLHEQNQVATPLSYRGHQPQTTITEEEWAAARARRVEQAKAIAEAGWSAGEQALFNRLNNRSFEPMIPKAWKHGFEFSGMPDYLFTDDPAKQYLRNLPRTDGTSPSPNAPLFCLKKALDLGPRIRGCEASYERPIRHAFDTYTKWAVRDSGFKMLRDRLDVYAVVQRKHGESGEVLQDKMMRELELLEQKWRKQLDGRTVTDGDEDRPFPQLYGIIIASSVLGLLTYVPEDRRAQPSVEDPVKRASARALRVLSLFNFARDEYDVWNGLAMSIIAVHLRDELVKAYTETGLVDDLGYVEESESDE